MACYTSLKLGRRSYSSLARALVIWTLLLIILLDMSTIFSNAARRGQRHFKSPFKMKRRAMKWNQESWYFILGGAILVFFFILYFVIKKTCPQSRGPELDVEDVHLEQFDSIVLDLGISKKFDDAKSIVAEFDFDRLKKTNFLNTERWKETASNAGDAIAEGFSSLRSKLSSKVGDLDRLKYSVRSRINDFQNSIDNDDEDNDERVPLREAVANTPLPPQSTPHAKNKNLWDDWNSIADKKDTAAAIVEKKDTSGSTAQFKKPLDPSKLDVPRSIPLPPQPKPTYLSKDGTTPAVSGLKSSDPFSKPEIPASSFDPNPNRFQPTPLKINQTSIPRPGLLSPPRTNNTDEATSLSDFFAANKPSSSNLILATPDSTASAADNKPKMLDRSSSKPSLSGLPFGTPVVSSPDKLPLDNANSKPATSNPTPTPTIVTSPPAVGVGSLPARLGPPPPSSGRAPPPVQGSFSGRSPPPMALQSSQELATTSNDDGFDMMKTMRPGTDDAMKSIPRGEDIMKTIRPGFEDNSNSNSQSNSDSNGNYNSNSNSSSNINSNMNSNMSSISSSKPVNIKPASGDANARPPPGMPPPGFRGPLSGPRPGPRPGPPPMLSAPNPYSHVTSAGNNDVIINNNSNMNSNMSSSSSSKPVNIKPASGDVNARPPPGMPPGFKPVVGKPLAKIAEENNLANKY